MRELMILIGIFFLIIGGSVPVFSQALPPLDPGYTHYIIPDEDFTGGFHLTPADIQDLLEAEGEDCEGEYCLKDYEDEETGMSAAEIIHHYAQEFALHPFVILITLQKENSLVTDDEPEDWQHRTAMGYGCPDDADCESDFFGLENQIRLGTNLLRASYNRACGDRLSYFNWWVHPQMTKHSTVIINAQPTYIGNCATAALYNYTPHRVDSAWNDVDGQYYYGNYNFVILYQRWYEEFL